MAQRIVFLDRDTIGPGVALRRPAFAHDWAEYGRTAPHEVAERLAGAGIAITNKVRLDRAVLERLPALRLIAVAATGTDIVDKAAARDHGIAVCNIRGYAVHTVPEHVFALILALRRNLMGYAREVAAGAWQRAGQFCFFNRPIRDLHGSRLAIVGGGAIGQAVGALGRAFGMEVAFVEHKGAAAVRPGRIAFAEMLETADIVSLHCPLTAETAGLLGAAEFAAMRRAPLIVNTARGGLIEPAALVAALEGGRIGGAAIDVLAEEPPPDDHPYMRLLDRPDFILTPHVGWASVEAMQALADQLIDNIEAFEAGRPRHLVTV